MNASASIVLNKQTIEVRFQKRAHNPLLLAAGFEQTDVSIPWLDLICLSKICGATRKCRSSTS